MGGAAAARATPPTATLTIGAARAFAARPIAIPTIAAGRVSAALIETRPIPGAADAGAADGPPTESIITADAGIRAGEARAAVGASRLSAVGARRTRRRALAPSSRIGSL